MSRRNYHQHHPAPVFLCNAAQTRHVTFMTTKTVVRKNQENDSQTGSHALTRQCLCRGGGGTRGGGVKCSEMGWGDKNGLRAGYGLALPGKGGGWHKASVLGCLPLAAPIGLSLLLILTLCGSERVLVVSTEPLDDFLFDNSGVGCPGDGLLPVPLTRCIQMHTPSPCGGLPTPALTCAR